MENEIMMKSEVMELWGLSCWEYESVSHAASIEHLAETRGVSVVYGAMSLHGGCIGTDETKMRQAIQQTVSRFDSVLDAVSDPLMPSQTAWCIIHQCVVSSVGFYIRITQPHITHDAVEEFDRKVIKAIDNSEKDRGASLFGWMIDRLISCFFSPSNTGRLIPEINNDLSIIMVPPSLYTPPKM